jgi:hypothetical protein
MEKWTDFQQNLHSELVIRDIGGSYLDKNMMFWKLEDDKWVGRKVIDLKNKIYEDKTYTREQWLENK